MIFSFFSQNVTPHWGRNVTILLGLPYCVNYGKLFIGYVTIFKVTILYKYSNVTIL